MVSVCRRAQCHPRLHRETSIHPRRDRICAACLATAEVMSALMRALVVSTLVEDAVKIAKCSTSSKRPSSCRAPAILDIDEPTLKLEYRVLLTRSWACRALQITYLWTFEHLGVLLL